jgi:hypothetical protein
MQAAPHPLVEWVETLHNGGNTLRDMFRGYYQPTKDEVVKIWRDGLISLDANVLLSLYNVQPTTSTLYLNAMEQRKTQMWIPYQVAMEFHRNVHKERSRQTTAHQNRITKIDGLLGDLRSTAKKSRLRASPAQEEAVESLNALKDELVTERDTIAEQTSHRTPDALLDRISGLFSGQVGVEPDQTTLDAMFEDGEKRFAEEVPPGFEDAKTKTGNRKYGDYVLWRQLMDHAANEKRDIIFVTDDDKADWWLKIEKMSVAPRPELIQEFRSETGQDILILNSSQFYHHLVPAAHGDTTRTEQVIAAQEDMEAAVSEAKETLSIYEGLKASLGNRDNQHAASIVAARTNSLVKKYLTEGGEADDVIERFAHESHVLAVRRAERDRLTGELDSLSDRRNEIELLFRTVLPGSELPRDLIQEHRDVLMRQDMLRERLEDLDRLI